MGEHSLEDLGMTPRERQEFELRARVERAVTDAVISRRVDAVMAIVIPITERAERAEHGDTQRDQLAAWLDELDAAAGLGSIADVAARQRQLGVEGDHETRLRGKRVAKLKAIVMEETEWRREVLHEWQERAERAEAAFDRYQQAKQPLARSFAMACKEIADLRQQLKLAEHVNTHSGE